MSTIRGISSAQLRAIHRITQLGQAIEQNTLRLSTLKRINSAKDDPSGLIQASLLESELAAAEKVQQGISRANGMLQTADATAGQIKDLLDEAKTLAIEATGSTATAATRSANQIEIDSILESINSLAQTTFGGKRLIDGSASFRASGYDTSEILEVNVLDKQLAADVSVDVEITTQATQAANSYTDGTPGVDTTLTVTGSRGSTTITLDNNASRDDVVAAFNAVTQLTGVQATKNGSQVDFTTVDYGSEAELTIEVVSGSFTLTTSGTTTGTDAVATINGQSVTGNGTSFDVVSSGVAFNVVTDPSASGTLTSFTISGEGLNFVVGTGPGNTIRTGLPSLLTSRLGGITGSLNTIGSGFANALTGSNPENATLVIDEAIGDVNRARAQIGGFQKYVLDSASNVVDAQVEQTTSALSSIQDTDVAVETALLSSNQLMQQTTFQALQISGLSNSNVLSLIQSASQFL
jgi:flagellin